MDQELVAVSTGGFGFGEGGRGGQFGGRTFALVSGSTSHIRDMMR